MSFPGEAVFTEKKDIKYVFQPATIKSDHLLVVFSGFSSKGIKPEYNYTRVLENFDVNKLFILDDYGVRGCYYLGKEWVFDVEDSVISLIHHIAENNNCQRDNVICCGSSKGGFAALYFGIKYKFGHVISGAPQTKIGSYLIAAKAEDVLEYIIGSITDANIKTIDALLFDEVLKTSTHPLINIFVGSGDHHYKNHVLPFTKYLEEHHIDYSLDVKNYYGHGGIAKHFPSFLRKSIIDKIPYLKDSLLTVDLTVEQQLDTFHLLVSSSHVAKYALYVYKDKHIMYVEWYSDKNSYEFTAKEKGCYEFTIFAKDENGHIISENSDEFVV